MTRVFPLAAIANGQLVELFESDRGFIGPAFETEEQRDDGAPQLVVHERVQHPPGWGAAWSADDWALFCPGWSLLPVVGTPPAADALAQQVTLNPPEQWTIGASQVTRTWTVADLSPEQIDQLHPRLHLSGWQACSAIIGTIGPSRFSTMYADPALLLLRVRIDTCRDVDPADMPGVFALINSVNAAYITDDEAVAIMTAWPRA